MPDDPDGAYTTVRYGGCWLIAAWLAVLAGLFASAAHWRPW